MPVMWRHDTDSGCDMCDCDSVWHEESHQPLRVRSLKTTTAWPRSNVVILVTGDAETRESVASEQLISVQSDRSNDCVMLRSIHGIGSVLNALGFAIGGSDIDADRLILGWVLLELLGCLTVASASGILKKKLELFGNISGFAVTVLRTWYGNDEIANDSHFYQRLKRCTDKVMLQESRGTGGAWREKMEAILQSPNKIIRTFGCKLQLWLSWCVSIGCGGVWLCK